MDTHTHAAAACAIYDALPRAAQDFLRLSDLELRHWARIPDEQDHDNLLRTGCDTGEECYAHSYKLQPDGRTPITGSAPTVIAQAPRECVSAVREGRYDEARETMVKAFSHYAVDLCTPWHVTRELPRESHSKGEKILARLPLPAPIRPVDLTPANSLYEAAVSAAEDTHRLFVGRIVDGEALDGALGREILAHALGFGAAVAHYIWHYLDQAA
jgi:hypothetical protein